MCGDINPLARCASVESVQKARLDILIFELVVFR